MILMHIEVLKTLIESSSKGSLASFSNGKGLLLAKKKLKETWAL